MVEKPVTDPQVIKRLPPGTMTEITDPEELKRLEGKSTPDPWTTLGERAAIAFGFPLAVLALGSSGLCLGSMRNGSLDCARITPKAPDCDCLELACWVL